MRDFNTDRMMDDEDFPSRDMCDDGALIMIKGVQFDVDERTWWSAMLKVVEITEVCAVHFPLKCAEVDKRGARLTPQGSAWIRFYRKEKRDWFMRVMDGKQICYKFSNKDERCEGECGRAHVCQA